MLAGAPWREFFPAAPTRRLTILKQCLEVILASGTVKISSRTALGMETAYGLARVMNG